MYYSIISWEDLNYDFNFDLFSYDWIFIISLSKHQSVSESVCLFVWLFVCLFPNSSETSKPDELKFWGMIFLWMQNILDEKPSDSSNRKQENNVYSTAL